MYSRYLTHNALTCSLAPPACLSHGQSLRERMVESIARSPLPEFHRVLLGRTASHRQLPAAQDHRQRQFRQSQVGTPHLDRQGGKTGAWLTGFANWLTAFRYTSQNCMATSFYGLNNWPSLYWAKENFMYLRAWSLYTLTGSNYVICSYFFRWLVLLYAI